MISVVKRSLRQGEAAAPSCSAASLVGHFDLPASGRGSTPPRVGLSIVGSRRGRRGKNGTAPLAVPSAHKNVSGPSVWFFPETRGALRRLRFLIRCWACEVVISWALRIAPEAYVPSIAQAADASRAATHENVHQPSS